MKNEVVKNVLKRMRAQFPDIAQSPDAINLAISNIHTRIPTHRAFISPNVPLGNGEDGIRTFLYSQRTSLAPSCNPNDESLLSPLHINSYPWTAPCQEYSGVFLFARKGPGKAKTSRKWPKAPVLYPMTAYQEICILTARLCFLQQYPVHGFNTPISASVNNKTVRFL